jgi:hypothetical protein
MLSNLQVRMKNFVNDFPHVINIYVGLLLLPLLTTVSFMYQ